MRTLRVTSGPLSGHSLEVERDVVIGRQDADLTIPDSELSRRHAVVRPVDGGVTVEDLGSLNGTFVDGVRIGDRVTLTGDVTLRLGRSLVAVELDLGPLAPAPPLAAPGGRTRVATPVARPPDPPARLDGPAVTRVRPVPEPVADPPVAPLSPAVTRVRPVPEGVTDGAEREPGAPSPPAPDGDPAAAGSPPPIVAAAVTRVRPLPALEDGPAPAADPLDPGDPGGPADPAPPRRGGLRARLRGLMGRGVRP